jgi:hypothetical protein
MSEDRRVLALFDGSPAACAALSYALFVAEHTGCGIDVVLVSGRDPPARESGSRAEAERLVRGRDVAVDWHVAPGNDALEELLAVARHGEHAFATVGDGQTLDAAGWHLAAHCLADTGCVLVKVAPSDGILSFSVVH